MPAPPIFINPVPDTPQAPGPSTNTPIFINPVSPEAAQSNYQAPFPEADKLLSPEGDFGGSWMGGFSNPADTGLMAFLRWAGRDENGHFDPHKASAKGLSFLTGSALGAPGWASLLQGATTQSGSDAAVNASLNAAIPLAGQVKTASRGVNSILGALKGWGLYKGAQAEKAAIDQKPMPDMIPTSVGDMAGQGLSALAGATEGVNSLPPGLTKFQTKMNAWLDHKQQFQQAEQAKIGATRAVDDATTALNQHEKMLKPQGAGELKDLSNQITDQKQKVSDAANAVDNHQQFIDARQKQQAIDAAENIQDQILESQRRLRNLGNPDVAANFLEEGDLTDNLKNSLKAGKGFEDEDLASSIRQAKINEQNKLADLRVQQRRMNQGRFDNVPTDEDLSNWKKLATLKDNHLQEVQALSDLNQKYAKLTSTQLAHAAAGGAPVADQAAIAQHQKLVQGVQDAELARRKAEDVYLNLKHTAPDKPQGNEKMDTIYKFVKAALPSAATGLVAHAEGGSGALSGVLMGALGLATAAARNSPRGQQLIDLVNQHIGQTATHAIPAIANWATGDLTNAPDNQYLYNSNDIPVYKRP